MGLEERVERDLELRAVRPERPRQFSARAHRQVRDGRRSSGRPSSRSRACSRRPPRCRRGPRSTSRADLRPPGLRARDAGNGRSSLLLEPRVELLEMLPVARRLPDEDFLAGEIVERRQLGDWGPVTTISLTGLVVDGIAKSTSLSRSVVIVNPAAMTSPSPGKQIRHHLLARRREEDDVDFQVATLLVELVLEGLERLVRDAPWLATLDEVERLGVRERARG